MWILIRKWKGNSPVYSQRNKARTMCCHIHSSISFSHHFFNCDCAASSPLCHFPISIQFILRKGSGTSVTFRDFWVQSVGFSVFCTIFFLLFFLMYCRFCRLCLMYWCVYGVDFWIIFFVCLFAAWIYHVDTVKSMHRSLLLFCLFLFFPLWKCVRTTFMKDFYCDNNLLCFCFLFEFFCSVSFLKIDHVIYVII